MLEILAGKSRAFDAYARHSDTAESAPEALDISEQSLARLIVEAEQLRLAGAVTLAKGPLVPEQDQGHEQRDAVATAPASASGGRTG
jgi:hypothetical protein